MQDHAKILLLSQTGKGKTYSFRNMDENTTGFINVENKPLPFKKNFKFYGKPKTVSGIIKNINDYANNKEITCIVIDSMSAIFDIVEKEMSNNFSGYDIWSNYNRTVAEIIDLIKGAPKEVFITGHYEVLNIDKAAEKRMKTVGKRWEGVVEKEFAIVMYGESKFKDDVGVYQFRLAGEGISAKVPPDIFPGKSVIPNDSKEILDAIQRYYS